jgi:hypothetical protein
MSLLLTTVFARRGFSQNIVNNKQNKRKNIRQPTKNFAPVGKKRRQFLPFFNPLVLMSRTGNSV